jgi:hypothetical protein
LECWEPSEHLRLNTGKTRISGNNLMFVPSIIRRSRNNQHNAQI